MKAVNYEEACDLKLKNGKRKKGEVKKTGEGRGVRKGGRGKRMGGRNIQSTFILKGVTCFY